VRAIPNVTAHARELKDASDEQLQDIVAGFDRETALEEAERAIRDGRLD